VHHHPLTFKAQAYSEVACSNMALSPTGFAPSSGCKEPPALILERLEIFPVMAY